MTVDKRIGASVASISIMLLLNACSSLPSSGPTGREIYSASEAAEKQPGFEIVELDSVAAVPQDGRGADGELVPPLFPGRQQPSNLVGPGDVLDITIFEAGVSLFSGPNSQGTDVDVGVKGRQISSVRIDDDGVIALPYAGRISAIGHTTTELQRMIEAALRGQSERPQVLVTMQKSVTNSVIVYGEVKTAGRQVLATNHERLLDVIAMAGGYQGEASALLVRVEREGQIFSARLAAIQRTSAGNMTVYPGDRISVLREQESFSVLGAAGRVSQLPFEKASLNLAEAIARSGGVDDNRGDPKAIFVFRFIRAADGTEKPVVYHLNMMTAQAYFVSQRFAMRDQDVLYVGNADANRPSKAVGIISQFFSPFVAVRAVVSNRLPMSNTAPSAMTMPPGL